MNWAWFFAGGLAATLAITLGGIAVVLFLAWTGRRRDHGDRLAEEQALALTKQPAPGAVPPRAPEQTPGHDCGRLLFTIRGWEGGCVLQWDRFGRVVRTTPCNETRDWDEELRRLTDASD